MIEAGPCTVTYKATEEKEGYNAVQLGYEDVAEKKLSNEGFTAKAPAAVVEGERAKLQKYIENRQGVAEALAKMK